MHALFSSERRMMRVMFERWEKRRLSCTYRKGNIISISLIPSSLFSSGQGISVPWELLWRYHTLPGRRDFIPRSCTVVTRSMCSWRGKKEPPNLLLIHQNTRLDPLFPSPSYNKFVSVWFNRRHQSVTRRGGEKELLLKNWSWRRRRRLRADDEANKLPGAHFLYKKWREGGN